MDFSALIKKSFSIAWENKILWLFGFLSGGVGSAGVMNPSGFNFSIPSPGSETPTLENEQTDEFVLGAYDTVNQVPSETWIALAIGAAVIVIILLILGIFVANWAASALVYSVLQRNVQRPTFGSGAGAGLKYWWKFYLIGLVFVLFFLAVTILLALPVGVLFLAGFKTPAIATLIAVGVVFFLFMIVYSIIGSVIVVLSQRLIIHKGAGVMESIRLSGGLLKKHKGDSFLTYLVAIGLNIAVGFLSLFVFLPLIIVFGVLFFLKLWWLIVVIAIPVVLALFTAGGFWQAFNAAYWTLFYEHLAAKEGW
jgi:hypothetical protein